MVAHTVYTHLVDPRAALAEAHRVLKPGGRLAIFDADFASLSVALFDGDPLQSAAAIVLRHMVHGPHIMRQLPRLVAAAELVVQVGRAPCLRPDDEPGLPADLFSRAMGAAGRAGEIGQAMVESFDAEARRRVADQTFFGSLTFLSVTARKGR